MHRGLLVLLAVCAFAAAMVPTDRRAVHPEEQEKSNYESTVCERTTPCAWAVYSRITFEIDTNITNTYCHCGENTICLKDEDNVATSVYVFRCREPGHKMGES